MRSLKLFLCGLLLLLSIGAQATTYSQPLTVSFGVSYTGQAANVKYSVVDAAGTTQIAATGTGIAEDTDAAGNATTGSYAVTATFSDAWAFPVKVKWVITGVSSVCATTTVAGNSYLRLGTPAGASVSADIAS